jgi:two-component system phosphate regulon sensor histidine kinase PhoR
MKSEQFHREINNSLIQSRDFLHEKFLKHGHQYIPDEESKEFFLKDFTTQIFSDSEIQLAINKALIKNNIHQPFEFCIMNIFKNPVSQSDNFQIQDLNNAYSIRLTPDISSQQETLYLLVKEDRNYIIRQMGPMILASIIFTTIIILAFVVTVRTIFNQKKISEIKSDFINNMTHELKTPLATISLAIDALTNNKVISDQEKIRYYSAMIKEENRRMNKQVEKILQAARLEKQDIKLNLQKMDAHELIRKVADNLILQIQEKNGTIELKLAAAKHVIEADEVHFSNIIFNLLDNAIKYSKESGLRIIVETELASNDMIAIKVIDNGIGMSKETQSRIFEKFYRAHTGNIHNVKGFGLGLTYVKALVDAHGGKVKVDSFPDKGSTFTISMKLV